MRRRRLTQVALVMASGGAVAMATGMIPNPVVGAATTVTITTAVVEGKTERILADAKGFALYYLTSDTPRASACTGGCAAAWPPLLSMRRPTAPPGLPGTLAVVRTVHGPQVSYAGHLLYRYAGDTKPGEVRGNDLKGPAGGEWYVATPGLFKAGGSWRRLGSPSPDR